MMFNTQHTLTVTLKSNPQVNMSSEVCRIVQQGSAVIPLAQLGPLLRVQGHVHVAT